MNETTLSASGDIDMAEEFHEQLIEFLPKMRVWALALTRN